jgi:elongation factor G
MPDFYKEKIRNIALIGHSGEGKTSLLEAILNYTKATTRLGRIEDGNTVSDHTAEEIDRKMSINLTMAYVNYKDYKYNFLDVPGFFDFEGEMISALSVADFAIIATSASGAFTVGTEKSLEYCVENKIPVLIYVGGIDKENSNYFTTVEAIKAKYSMVEPIEFPIANGNIMEGFVSVLENCAYDRAYNKTDIPADLKDKAQEAKDFIVEYAAESSDELLEKFFGGEELSPEEIKAGCKARIKAGEFIPVVAGVNVGDYYLANLLENIADIMPGPADKEITATTPNGESVSVPCDETAKFSGDVFKTIVDPFVGKLLMFKVRSGKISVGDTIYNSTRKENERVTALYILRGKKQDNVDTLYAGDIGALAKLNYTSFGDSLTTEDNKMLFKPIVFPELTMQLAVRAADGKSDEKVISGLQRLAEEDPTITIEKHRETGDMLLTGIGESQLNIICQKLKNKFKVEAVLSNPRIPYRETIRKTVEQQGRHKKQSGGHGQYGDVHIRFEPKPEVDFEFDDEIVGGVVPKQYIPAVEKGLRESIMKGVLAGYPVVGLKAVLYFGSYHDVDSSELAFKLAASIAYKEGLVKASPVLLEPIYTIRVKVPEEYMGDVMGDLNKRRGRIMGMESHGGKAYVNAEVPQAEIFRYSTELRSMTTGLGTFTKAFARYEEVPGNLVDKIIKESKERENQ